MLHVPTVKEFDKSEYLDAPELGTIAKALIKEDHTLEWILSLRITYLWKRTLTKSKGTPVAGQVQKTPKLLRHFVNTEWVIWLAAPFFVECEASDIEIERTVYHELLHLVENPKTGKATTRGHDREYFDKEEERYRCAGSLGLDRPARAA